MHRAGSWLDELSWKKLHEVHKIKYSNINMSPAFASKYILIIGSAQENSVNQVNIKFQVGNYFEVVDQRTFHSEVCQQIGIGKSSEYKKFIYTLEEEDGELSRVKILSKLRSLYSTSFRLIL